MIYSNSPALNCEVYEGECFNIKKTNSSYRGVFLDKSEKAYTLITLDHLLFLENRFRSKKGVGKSD